MLNEWECTDKFDTPIMQPLSLAALALEKLSTDNVICPSKCKEEKIVTSL